MTCQHSDNTVSVVQIYTLCLELHANHVKQILNQHNVPDRNRLLVKLSHIISNRTS